MPDLNQLLRDDYETYSADMRAYGDQLRGKRKKLGPRNRKALREHVLDQPVEQSLPMLEKMYAAAKHRDGETTPCAACRFLGEK